MQALTAAKLPKVPKEEREKGISKLVDNEVQFGPVWQSALLIQVAREAAIPDLRLVLSPSAVAGEEPSAFNPLRPRLFSCCCSDVEKGRVLLRCVLHDRILALLARGPSGEENIRLLMDAVRPFTPALVEHQALKEACEQIQEIVAYFDIILGSREVEDAAGVLARIGSSTGRGAIPLLRKAINTSPHFKKLDGDLRSSMLALKTMLPEITAAIKDMSENANCATFEKHILKVPTWRDSLPEASVQPVVVVVKNFVQSEWGRIQNLPPGSSDIATFLSLLGSLKRCMPKEPEHAELYTACVELQKLKLAELGTQKLRTCLEAWTKDLKGS